MSNEFYALFLDPLMVYTCAYYRDPDGKLEQAQQDKLDHVCRKLELQRRRDPARHRVRLGQPGDLGGPALRRARPRRDAVAGAGRLRRPSASGGKGSRTAAAVDYLDYRDLPPDVGYDKIAAVGVIEHVGIPNYPAFFGGVRAVLKDGGLYLNHGIVHEFHWKRTSQTEFLYRHVFPNGDLAGLSETLDRDGARGLGDRGRRGAAAALRAHVPALGRAAARAGRRGAGAWPASAPTGPGCCT